MSDEWLTIHGKLKQSTITEFKSDFATAGNRAVQGISFDQVNRRKIQILAKFGRYIRTDIARFYPSIYTHSIAWALHGKSWCKANRKSSEFSSCCGNRLDKAVLGGQSGQTMGIPVGPDTSRVIAELIATELEILTAAGLPDLPARGIRYVDDWIIGFSEAELASNIVSKLSSALHQYELELNGDKTSVYGIGRQHAPDWIHFVRTFKISKAATRQLDDIDSFFQQVLHLADCNDRESVTLYAAKRAASFDVAPENWSHFVRWLLYIARRSSECLSFVVQHLSIAHAAGRPLPLNEVKSFIKEQIVVHAGASHTGELSWLLFWAREIRMRLTTKTIEGVFALNSSVCALIVLDLAESGALTGTVDTSHWESFANEDGLKSEMWLVAYEATIKKWWPKNNINSDFITKHAFFKELWNKNVQFYNRSRKSKPQVIVFPASIGGTSGGGTSFGYPD